MSMVPPPGMAAGAPPTGEFGPAPTPGAAAPALPGAAPAPQPSAMQDVTDIVTVVNALKSIGERHPQAVPVLAQIADLVQQLQMKIVQAQPMTEPMAPPVA